MSWSALKKFENVKRWDAFSVRPEDVVIIGLDTSDGPEHPLFDERARKPISEEMIRNVAHEGVQTPIAIKKDGDRLLVVFGRQRVKAAREANKRLAAAGSDTLLVPAVIKNGDEDDLFAISLSENEVRTDDDPMIKARKLKRYLDRGHTTEDAAIVFGVTSATIRNWTALLNAPTEVRAAVKNCRLSATAAAQLGGLSQDEQKAKLAEVLATTKEGKRATVTAVKDAVKPRVNRMLGRREIEAVIAHKPAELKALDGMTAIRWVLGGLELEELKIEDGKEGKE